MYVIVHCSSLARYVSEGCNADEQRVLGDELAFTLKRGRRLIIVCSVERCLTFTVTLFATISLIFKGRLYLSIFTIKVDL